MRTTTFIYLPLTGHRPPTNAFSRHVPGQHSRCTFLPGDSCIWAWQAAASVGFPARTLGCTLDLDRARAARPRIRTGFPLPVAEPSQSTVAVPIHLQPQGPLPPPCRNPGGKGACQAGPTRSPSIRRYRRHPHRCGAPSHAIARSALGRAKSITYFHTGGEGDNICHWRRRLLQYTNGPCELGNCRLPGGARRLLAG